MEKINITNHPDIPTVTRKITVTDVGINYLDKTIRIGLHIEHYNEADELISNFPKIRKSLVVRNSRKVDVNGDEVLPGDEGYDIAIPEFDAIENSPNSNLPTKGEEIEELITYYILRRDSQGIFNIY